MGFDAMPPVDADAGSGWSLPALGWKLYLSNQASPGTLRARSPRFPSGTGELPGVWGLEFDSLTRQRCALVV